MDPYAAEAHDEFFAVASEYYFSAPDVLLEHWDGNPRALGYLMEGVEEVGALLPAGIRNALRGLV